MTMTKEFGVIENLIDVTPEKIEPSTVKTLTSFCFASPVKVSVLPLLTTFVLGVACKMVLLNPNRVLNPELKSIPSAVRWVAFAVLGL